MLHAEPPVELNRLSISRQWHFAAVLGTAAFFLMQSLWIPVKAELAQFLLERAWADTLSGHPGVKPWPWADTYPVGILEVPRLGIRQIVLSGTSGRNLAFGPTLLTTHDQEDLVLSGHRDTHFKFLEELRPGEKLTFRNLQGSFDYRVAWLEIIDSREKQMVLEPGTSRLTLTTCYPFDAVIAGGPLRYVVTAEPVRPSAG